MQQIAGAPAGGRYRPTLHDYLGVIVGLAVVSVAAWGYMLHEYYTNRIVSLFSICSLPTGGAPWSVADFSLAFVMWTVMMIGMMAPTAAPMVAIFNTVSRRRRSEGQAYVPTAVFVAGYLGAWTGFSVLAALLQWPLHRWSLLTPDMDVASTRFAGLMLIGAGLYQWTPWKQACLHKCRTPLQFVLTEWEEGKAGALRMGLRHGLFCVGCCWALMLVMFAVGVMNLLWALLITLFVLVEKALPGGGTVVRSVSGLLLLAWGAWTLML